MSEMHRTTYPAAQVRAGASVAGPCGLYSVLSVVGVRGTVSFLVRDPRGRVYTVRLPHDARLSVVSRNL